MISFHSQKYYQLSLSISAAISIILLFNSFERTANATIKCTPKSYNFIWFENPPSPNANNQTHWNHNKRNRIHEMQLIVKLFNTNIWNCFANQLVG